MHIKSIPMRLLFSISAVFVLLTAQANADQADVVTQLQKEWAVANYQLEGDSQKQAFDALLEKAAASEQQASEDANVIIWSGIIKSSYAGVKGGMGALKYVKAAKANFEKALEIDPQALNGSAYGSLGVLYFKVPGWPIAFGDKKQAKKLLRKALEINPDGIDSNYFYADFLINAKKYSDARPYLEKALAAPARVGREIADAGRRKEIQAALAKIATK